MVACPYNARHLLTNHRRDKRNPRNVADKCDFCIVRVTRGLAPLCVSSCTGGAMVFGDRNDKNSEVTRLIRDNKTFTLRPESGNEPQVFYIGMDGRIADPEFAFHHRSEQMHARNNTFIRGNELGGELGGDIIDTEMDFLGLMKHIGRNFKSFFSAVPEKFFRGLF